MHDSAGMERRRIPLSLTLDPATIAAVRKAAAEDGRSVSAWVDRALASALGLHGNILAELVAEAAKKATR